MFAASKSGQSAVAVTPDPYFKYVPLLLETTSTNGQQNNTFLDSSTNNFTITRNGTPTQGSVTPYWPNGYWSNNFNGSSDYLTAPNNAALALGSGDFTVEFWAYLSSTSGAYFAIDSRNAGADAGFAILFETSSGYNVRVYRNGAYLLTSSSVVAANTWYHVAFVRSGATSYLYLNGGQVASAADSNTYVEPGTFKIANGWNFGNPFPGYLSNIRIVKGTAVYTGAFTPPTTPLTAITNTSLLTCQGNRFKDNSTNNFAITTAGTPRVQAFQPFSPTASYTTAAYGGSGYLNGSTDYLSAGTSSTAFAFGASVDFTVECWVYLTAYSSGGILGGALVGTTFSASSGWFINSGQNIDTLRITSDASGGWGDNITVTAGNGLPLNQWTHIAFVRNGGTLTLYKNGNSVGSITGTSAYNFTSPGNTAYIGYAQGRYVPGYISNVRIVKGTAVYTGAFTPPTAPVTAITNTSFLVNFTNAGIYDAAVQNNALTVGSAQASISQYKWSPTSMRFNGTTDYLSIPSGPANFGTGDFTIEGWVNFTSAGGGYPQFLSAGGAAFPQFAFTSNTQIYFYDGTTTYAGNFTFTFGTWYYVAWTRGSGVLKIYVNGTQLVSTSYASAINLNTAFVGAYSNGLANGFLNGYIQDLRITRGIARTITTPTAAFPTR